MNLRKTLEAIVDGMPDDASVTLTVSWLRAHLEAEVKRAGEEPDDLLTLDEVGRRTKRAISTVRAWCNNGSLEGAFKLNGKDWRIPSKALKSYLEGHQKGTRPPKCVPGYREPDLDAWRREGGKKGKGKAA